MDGLVFFSSSAAGLILRTQITRQRIKPTNITSSKVPESVFTAIESNTTEATTTKCPTSSTTGIVAVVGPTKITLHSIIDELEDRVQRDEGNRGIKYLCSNSNNLNNSGSTNNDRELWSIVTALNDPAINNITILTGFPCLIECEPPTETDGPLGAIAIARALLAINKNKQVKIITDECNEEVILVAVAASGLHETYFSYNASGSNSYSSYGDPTSGATNQQYQQQHQQQQQRLSLESFPNQFDFHLSDATRMKEIAEWSDAVIAIERPGPNQYGDYLTMSGYNNNNKGETNNNRNMNHLVAPLEDIIGYRMKVPGNIIDELLSTSSLETETEGNNSEATSIVIRISDFNIAPKEGIAKSPPSSSSSQIKSSSLSSSSFLSIGIGDGGNEVGMGKIYDLLFSSDCPIPHTQDVACIVPTTYNLVSSVSNWGGYSIAAGLAVYHYHHQTFNNNGYSSSGSSSSSSSSVTKCAFTSSSYDNDYALYNDDSNNIHTSASSNNTVTSNNDVITQSQHQESSHLQTPRESYWDEHILPHFFSTEVLETIICSKMVACGARDGVTRRQEVTVDGLPWLMSMDVFYELKFIAKQVTLLTS